MPARSKAVERYWIEHYVNAGLCSLCGNSGIIDTRDTAMSHAGVCPGKVNFCICPNGQIMRSKLGDEELPNLLRQRLRMKLAHRTWTILVENLGAREDEREAFVRYLTDPDVEHYEYRFGGILGFGGKLYFSLGELRVGYYPEDRTQEKDAQVAEVNRLLKDLYHEISNQVQLD